MARTPKTTDFEQTLSKLSALGFELLRDAADSVIVFKSGSAARLAPASNSAAALVAGPGAWIGGQLAILVDRGYQKFLQAGTFAFPATAERLEDLHNFDAELRHALGSPEIFNEALGSISDHYQYDRLGSRHKASTTPQSPWEQAGH